MNASGLRAPVVAPLLLAVLLGGCFSSSHDDSGNPLGDGGVPDLGDRICNAVQVGQSFVQPMDSGNSTIPMPTGGALTDGSYHLTSSAYYPSASANCTADPVTTNLLVSSSSATEGTMQSATLTSTGFYVSESVSYVVGGSSLAVHIDCIAPDPGGLLGNVAQISFSATPSEIQLYGSGDCGSRIDVYDMD